VSSILGQLLRISARRQVAIYRREDRLWVADFIDGQGELMDATTWFRFHCGTEAATQARRRMVRESAIPISSQLAAKIERLHCPVSAAEDSATLALAETMSQPGSGGRFATMLRKLFRRWPARGADPARGGRQRTGVEIHRSGAT
jgi:hypothetical protein